MRRSHKAQASSLDLLFAILIFLSIFSLLGSGWRSLVMDTAASHEEMTLRAHYISDTLFESGGYPGNWGPGSVSVIGICSDRNVIDERKLVSLLDLMSSDYSNAKELFGLGAEEIYINITDMENNSVYFAGRPGNAGLPPTNSKIAAHTSSMMAISTVSRENSSLAIFVDNSGTMSALLADSFTRLEGAQLGIGNFLLLVKAGDEAALTNSSACGAIGTAQNFTKDMDNIRLALMDMEPGGLRPLAGAVEYTADLVNASANNSNRVMVVIADGGDLCAGNTDAAALYAIGRGVDTIYTIGLGVGPESVAESQLREMARLGRGKYYSANTTAELEAALWLAYAATEDKVAFHITVWR